VVIQALAFCYAKTILFRGHKVSWFDNIRHLNSWIKPNLQYYGCELHIRMRCDHIKFVDCPNYKIQEIKCPTNINDFTVNSSQDEYCMKYQALRSGQWGNLPWRGSCGPGPRVTAHFVWRQQQPSTPHCQNKLPGKPAQNIKSIVDTIITAFTRLCADNELHQRHHSVCCCCCCYFFVRVQIDHKTYRCVYVPLSNKTFNNHIKYFIIINSEEITKEIPNTNKFQFLTNTNLI